MFFQLFFFCEITSLILGGGFVTFFESVLRILIEGSLFRWTRHHWRRFCFRSSDSSTRLARTCPRHSRCWMGSFGCLRNPSRRRSRKRLPLLKSRQCLRQLGLKFREFLPARRPTHQQAPYRDCLHIYLARS